MQIVAPPFPDEEPPRSKFDAMALKGNLANTWRNTAWLKRNPWFEAEAGPWLQARVAAITGRCGA